MEPGPAGRRRAQVTAGPNPRPGAHRRGFLSGPSAVVPGELLPIRASVSGLEKGVAPDASQDCPGTPSPALLGAGSVASGSVPPARGAAGGPGRGDMARLGPVGGGQNGCREGFLEEAVVPTMSRNIGGGPRAGTQEGQGTRRAVCVAGEERGGGGGGQGSAGQGRRAVQEA